MPDGPATLDLSLTELREVARYAAACAGRALPLFEAERPGDGRPRAAIEASQAFADGAPRSNALRRAAWEAQGAAHDARGAGAPAAAQAARAALAAAGAGFLHPLAKASQVKHILGAAAHAARAFELSSPGDLAVAAGQMTEFQDLAPAAVIAVLRRYPRAPMGGGPVGEWLRQLDAGLR